MIWCYPSRTFSVCIMNCSYQFERGTHLSIRHSISGPYIVRPFFSGDTRRGDSDVSNQRADGAGFVL